MKPEVIHVDDMGREVLDVTSKANRPCCLRAERRGRHALVLTKCDKPVKCFDGKRRLYQVEEAVLSCDDDNELACVQCKEFNYYTRKDVLPVLKGKKSLFETVPFN